MGLLYCIHIKEGRVEEAGIDEPGVEQGSKMQEKDVGLGKRVQGSRDQAA